MAIKSFSGGDKFEKKLKEIASRLGSAPVLKVGFFETAKYPDGTNVAQVAYWNEFGTSRAPARPFFRHMIEQKHKGWGVSVVKTLKSNNFDVNKTLNLMGEGIKNQLQQSINNWTQPPNAPSTVQAKGFNKPLIDTATMLRSVGWEIDESS
jgi:hypothetical protein